LMAVKRDVVNEAHDIVKKSGFVPKAVSISLLCLLDLAKRKRTCKNVPGLIVIDIGAESSGIVIKRKKHIWLRSFSIGGKQISASIAQNAEIAFEKAETIKKRGCEGFSDIAEKDALFIKETISQNINTLVTEVERSISFYKMDQIGEDSDLDEETFKQFPVFVTGGGSKTEGLLELFKKRLGMQVSALQTFDGLKISRKALVKKQIDGLNRDNDITDESDPLLAVAVGAAIQGFQKEGEQINFLKKEIAVQKSFNASKLLRAAAFIFFFSAFIVHFFLQNEAYKVHKKHLDELERVAENVDAYGPQLEAVRQQDRLLEEDGLFLMTFLQKRFLWVALLAEISDALPDDVWVTNYQGSGRFSAESRDINEVILQGVTASYDDLNAFITALRRCSLVKEVKPESVVEQDDLFNFMLKLMVKDTPKNNPTVNNANRDA
jgi:cell division ATPase FtsA